MAPIATSETSAVSSHNAASLKSVPRSKFNYGNKGPDFNPPVPDDYMYDFKYPVELPTVHKLGSRFSTSFDVSRHTEKFINKLAISLETGCAQNFGNLFLADGVWRDKVVFTWAYRTFNGAEKIKQAASDIFPSVRVTNLSVLDPAPKIERPYDDLEFIQVHVGFKTHKAVASAVLNLVCVGGNELKIWTLATYIESLLHHPELPNRDGHMTGPLSWAKQRELDNEFEHKQPDVVIVGGGHNGLMMAARLKVLGVPTVIIEKNARIGDNWRNRYEALSLHFPHWADHMPYMSYPEHWPVYTPAGKLGDYLEWYASAMELHPWTNSSITNAEQLSDGTWNLAVQRGTREIRNLTPKHVIMCTSLAGTPYLPTIPSADRFNGVIRHSSQHDSSREWVGKKVLVVGTSSSGFDTAYDFARRDIDVTILQRSPTYIMSLTHSVPRLLGLYEPKDGRRPDLQICDRIAHSMPTGPGEEMGRRTAQTLEELDKPMTDAMEAKGFKTWRGQRGTGTQTLGATKSGGFYFDAGACEQVINGKIKVEQGNIQRFSESRVVLNDGREKEFDLVVLATGFTNLVNSIRNILGADVADRCGPIWGVNEEGEMRGVWDNSNVDNLWINAGTLQLGRFHSKMIALRIKADLEGVAGKPYRD